jgi:hypothetical protein
VKAYYSDKVVVLHTITKLILITSTLLGLTTLNSLSQDSEYDSLLNYYLKSDSILLDQLEQDLAYNSLDILDLIDSLLRTDINYSQLSLRLGYTSDITYAGRNFGIQQFGFGAGASYYHKTGLFADISGFWNSNIKPAFNPAITTIGYFGSFTNKWTFTTSYDHFFYNKVEDELSYFPITNSLNAATFLEFGKFTIAGEYSFLFGEESAHRARANLMYTLSKNNWGFIDRFVVMPSISMLLGSSYIYQINPVYPTMNLETRKTVRQMMIEMYGVDLIRYLWRNNREKYIELEKLTYSENREQFTDYQITSENVFGIMNYTFSLPLYFYINNFTFALSYHYNIPVALPGEDLSLEPNSYAGATIIYNIPFLKKNKK